MKKKADNREIREKRSVFERFCSAQENKARLSLILAAVLVVVTIGSVCTAAIANNAGVVFPSENVELNAAEQFLAKAAIESSESEELALVSAEESSEETDLLVAKETKRGGLTGEHVVDVSDLKSLTDEELVAAIKAGRAGVISRSNIETDQSQNQNNVHHGAGGNAPAATDTPTPVPSNVPTPTLAPVTMVNYQLGIDISEFQGSINWSKVKAAGIEFAFIRCGGRGWGSSGKIYEDTKFISNVNSARAAGIKVGAYFFSQAITPYEALEEASMTLSKVGAVTLDLPVVLDWETGGGYRTEDLKGQDFANVITSFCSTISQNGYTPCVYLNTGDINNRLGSYSGEILSKYKLWYAYPYSCYSDGSMYKAGDTIPPRSFSYEYWQYSWHGKVSGISTDVDLNIRILGKTTLNAPEINLTNEKITTGVGQAADLLAGVSAKTSQDQTTTSGITYEIKDSTGQAVTLEQAQQKAGTYTVTYTFKDSFRGAVTATATWEVVEGLTPTPSTSVTPTPTPAEGETTITPSPTPVDQNGETSTDTPTPTPSETEESTETSTDTPTPTPAEEGGSESGGSESGGSESSGTENGGSGDNGGSSEETGGDNTTT